EYRAFILATGGYQALVNYDSTTRPADVQRAWEDLVYGPDIQAPVIVLQGTADTTQYPRNSLVFTKAVIDAGRSERLRLYLVKGQGHMGWPMKGVLSAFEQMKLWVERGVPPGDVTFGAQAVQNNWDARFANDPCGYFHHQFDPEVQPPGDCGL